MKMATTETFGLLSLPPELRNMIFKEVLCLEKPIRLMWNPKYADDKQDSNRPHLLFLDKFDKSGAHNPATAVFRVSRQVNAETINVFYRQNTFTICIYMDLDWDDFYGESWPINTSIGLEHVNLEARPHPQALQKILRLQFEFINDEGTFFHRKCILGLSLSYFSQIPSLFGTPGRRLETIQFIWKYTDDEDPDKNPANGLLYAFGLMRSDKVEFESFPSKKLRGLKKVMTSHNTPSDMLDEIEAYNLYKVCGSTNLLRDIFKYALGHGIPADVRPLDEDESARQIVLENKIAILNKGFSDTDVILTNADLPDEEVDE